MLPFKGSLGAVYQMQLGFPSCCWYSGEYCSICLRRLLNCLVRPLMLDVLNCGENRRRKSWNSMGDLMVGLVSLAREVLAKAAVFLDLWKMGRFGLKELSISRLLIDVQQNPNKGVTDWWTILVYFVVYMKQTVTESSLNIGCRYLNAKYLPCHEHSGAVKRSAATAYGQCSASVTARKS